MLAIADAVENWNGAREANRLFGFEVTNIES